MYILKTIFLGTSAATPKPKGALPAIYLEHEGLGILMDVGEGTQFQLMKAKIGFSKIKVIVVSHMHGDHVLGLPGLIQTMAMASRREELTIIGPKDLKDFLVESFRLTKFWPPFDILFYPSPTSFKIRNVEISTFPVRHTIEAYGTKVVVRFKKKILVEKLEREGLPKTFWGRLQKGESVVWNGKYFEPEEYTWEPEPLKVVYSGDTAPCERLVKEAEGADLLIHEATFTSDMEEEAHERGHSTARDSAIIASKANVKALVMTHFSNRYESLHKHLEEARRVFPYSFVAEDLAKFLVLRKALRPS